MSKGKDAKFGYNRETNDTAGTTRNAQILYAMVVHEEVCGRVKARCGMIAGRGCGFKSTAVDQISVRRA